MFANHKVYNLIVSVSLLVPTLLVMAHPIGQQVYAVSAPTSGYSRGCSDAQISNPADRHINQTGKDPSFHSKAFMQAYNEGFDTCSDNSNSQSKSGGISDGAFTLQNPYWIPHDVDQGPGFKNIAVFMDNVDTSHNATYSEVCGRSGCLNVMNKANYSDILNVCLVSEVANITHKACHNIDTAKELHNLGKGNTGTVNAGVFVFPISMTLDNKKIRGCIEVSHISTCGTAQVFDTGHGLVMHLDTREAYNNYFDYYSGY
jgi:hypothetical protein